MKCPKHKNKIISVVVLILITAATTLFSEKMIENSRMETDLYEYMPYDHTVFVFSDQTEEIYNIKDLILIAIENKNGIYNPGTLKKVKDLTKELQKMEEINKDDVTSLYTAGNITGTETGLDIKDFYNNVPRDEEKLNQLKEDVRNNNMVFKRIVSENKEIALIIAEMEDGVFRMEFYHTILELGKSYEGPEMLYLAGIPIVEGSIASLARKDM